MREIEAKPSTYNIMLHEYEAKRHGEDMEKATSSPQRHRRLAAKVELERKERWETHNTRGVLGGINPGNPL